MTYDVRWRLVFVEKCIQKIYDVSVSQDNIEEPAQLLRSPFALENDRVAILRWFRLVIMPCY